MWQQQDRLAVLLPTCQRRRYPTKMVRKKKQHIHCLHFLFSTNPRRLSRLTGCDDQSPHAAISMNPLRAPNTVAHESHNPLRASAKLWYLYPAQLYGEQRAASANKTKHTRIPTHPCTSNAPKNIRYISYYCCRGMLFARGNKTSAPPSPPSPPLSPYRKVCVINGQTAKARRK